MRYFCKFPVLIILMLACVVQVSHAHRFYAAFTQINLRADKQTMEVTHRLFTHDVEDMLRSKLGNSSSLTDAEIEPVIREFIESSFALFDARGNRLPLVWVGMEYEIDNVHIYQETPLSENLPGITIINRLFMALFDDQKNTVNIEWNNEIRTLIFIKGDEQQSVNFQ